MKFGRAVPFESAATFAKGQSPADIYAYIFPDIVYVEEETAILLGQSVFESDQSNAAEQSVAVVKTATHKNDRIFESVL